MTRRLVIVLLLLTGCRNNTPEVVVGPKKAGRDEAAQTQVAIDIFRQGGDLPQYRDALNLLGAGLTRDEVARRFVLTPEDRAFLVDDAKLTPAEIGELEAAYFRPVDAAYVANVTVFRDAARFLEVPGLGEFDQAAFAFDWAMRRVLLYEQRHVNVPPTAILRAGHGNSTERGLVALALLRQFRVDGCLLIAPDMREAPLLGLLVQKQLYLFDLRLGEPVPGPGGKGIATWNDVVRQPDLLKASKLSAEQVAKLEGRMAAPLEALAPRMKYLESLLQGDETQVGGDRLAVSFDAGRVRRELQAAGLAKVGMWVPALRLDRGFTTVADGGLDASDPARELNRSQRFTLGLLPLTPVRQRYRDLHVFYDMPTPKARDKLLELTALVLDRYDVQPGEMLVRGKLEALPRRLDRIRTVIDEEEFASLDQDQLVQQAAKWRGLIEQAYVAEARKSPDAAAKMQAVWGEDEYLSHLIVFDVDDIPRSAKKTILSKLILTAVREPLLARANWLFASLCQDKAERAAEVSQVQKAGGKESKTSAENLRGAWLNARGAWTKYLDRNNTGPALYRSNQAALARPPAHPLDIDPALALWEHLQKEVHQYASARLELARAMRQLGQDPTAMLDQLAKDLDGLMNDKALAKVREDAPATGILNAPDGPRRWELLMRDWGPDGYLAWLVESVRMAKAANK